MNRSTLTFLALMLALTGCDAVSPTAHAQEPHAAHAEHDEHGDEKHDHAEHAGAKDGDHGKDGEDDHGHGKDGKDDHGHGKGGHDDHDDHGKEGKDAHDDHGKGGHDDHGKGGHGEGGHEEEEGAVHFSPKALARSGVRVAAVTTGALAGTLEVPAEVQLNPNHVAHISPLVEGQLLSVDVTLGDKVTSGQQLGRLRSIELGQARAELSRASSMRSIARKTLRRQEKLRAEGINSQRKVLAAQLTYEQAKAELDAATSRLRVFGVGAGGGPDMTLESPIDGLIVERHATRGENVAPDDTLFIVADLERVWVIGRVYEQQVSKIAKGMTATLTLNAYPARSWSGTVDFIGATLDEATRTLPIRVEMNNADGLLRPGLFGALRLDAGKAQGSAVLVPLTAVQTMENRTVVFVPGDEPGEFRALPVTLGREGRRQAEVLKGLEPGAKIVVQGAFVLKSELMRGQLGHGHAH